MAGWHHGPHPGLDRPRRLLRTWAANRTPELDRPVSTQPCEIVLTGRRGSNGRLLNVRCRCMAQTRRPAKPGFTGYDILGVAGTLAEALALWRAHRDAATLQPTPPGGVC